MAGSLKRKMYTALSAHLQQVEGVKLTERYYEQYVDAGRQHVEFSGTVLIDIKEINWEALSDRARGKNNPGMAAIDFYIGVVNHAESYRTAKGDSRSLDKSMDDFDFEQNVWNSLNGFSSICSGIKNITLRRTTNFLRSKALMVFKLEATTEVCDWNATC